MENIIVEQNSTSSDKSVAKEMYDDGAEYEESFHGAIETSSTPASTKSQNKCSLVFYNL